MIISFCRNVLRSSPTKSGIVGTDEAGKRSGVTVNPLAAAHILFLGLWGGLVLVEIAFEAQMFRGKLDEKSVAGLHRITDRFIEIPILIAVLLTG